MSTKSRERKLLKSTIWLTDQITRKFKNRSLQNFQTSPPPPGGLPYERGGDARRKFWSKPLKETNLGMAQPFFAP